MKTNSDEAAPEAEVRVSCPLVGVAVCYYFDSGDTVKKGESIAEIEAMKILNRLEAPCTGVITYLKELGEVVEQNEPVAVISPLSEDDVDLSRVTE